MRPWVGLISKFRTESPQNRFGVIPCRTLPFCAAMRQLCECSGVFKNLKGHVWEWLVYCQPFMNFNITSHPVPLEAKKGQAVVKQLAPFLSEALRRV